VDESLTSFIDEVCGDAHLRIEDDLGDGFVRLRTYEAQRRQAKHDIRCTEDIVIEMLRNAFDAGGKNIFLATSREGEQRRICIIDDGDGIPQNMRDTIFEPRVTSKLDSMHIDKWGVHGRGMALYSISANAEKAQVVNSEKGKGASLVVETNLNNLSEKTDQSTMPLISYDESGKLRVTGPHNINRTLAEFALEYEADCDVYIGSPTEVAATLYEFGNATVTKAMKAFCDNLEELPLVKRLCLAVDPAHFTDIALSLGLDISQRSARRILDGEIKALDPLLESLTQEPSPGPNKAGTKKKDYRRALLKDPRGLKIHDGDLREFSNEVKGAWAELAKRYYLEEEVNPEISLSQEGVSIKIPISKLY